MKIAKLIIQSSADQLLWRFAGFARTQFESLIHIKTITLVGKIKTRPTVLGLSIPPGVYSYIFTGEPYGEVCN